MWASANDKPLTIGAESLVWRTNANPVSLGVRTEAGAGRVLALGPRLCSAPATGIDDETHQGY